MRSFAFETVARQAGLSADNLARLHEAVRREFPNDEMMFELHMVRACMAIRDGQITLQDALRSDAGQLA